MIRIFPRKTNMTPTDKDAWYSEPEIMWGGNGQEVHISCAFTYDKCRAEYLAEQWSWAGYKAILGGPAYDDPGADFVPGRYVKPGMIMTSRGCNNDCWFCSVPKREGYIRELSIKEGWNILDSNLLQCSEVHIRNVFAMLARQSQKARFTGGLEAALLKDWHVDLLVRLKPNRFYFAYDIPDDYEPLAIAAQKVRAAGFRYWHASVYVLIAYPSDTMAKAEDRLQSVCRLGLKPFAMRWRDERGFVNTEWRPFQREWANPTIVGHKMKIYG